jgi:hypothetical protein
MAKKEKLEKMINKRDPFRTIKPVDLMGSVSPNETEGRPAVKEVVVRKQESKKAIKKESKKVSKQVSKSDLEWLDELASDVLDESSTTFLTPNTFRYSQDELKGLDRIVYELKQHDFKITRNAVIRMGLRLLLKDFDVRKKESLLVRFLAKHRR